MNVSDVKHQARIKTLETQVTALQGQLSNQKAQVDVEKVNLRAKVSVLDAQVKRFIRAEERDKLHVEAVVEAVTALDPLPRVAILKPKKSTSPVTALVHATDWHIGEYIEPAETEGFGNFNWELAQDRVLDQWLPRTLKWLNTQRSGYVIDEIVLLGTGDFVSGDIHDELRRTNEFPLPVQTAKAGDLFGAVGAALARHCVKLKVIEIGADNHSRLVQKPQAKQKTQNSMSTLVYHIANKVMERQSNIEVTIASGMKLLFDVNGHPILGEHGDTVKSWMGVPWYGMEREVAREAKRRMFSQGFKYVVMGHWHVPFFGQYIIGGSLSGTSEYDHSCGRNNPPAQTTMLFGKHGAFNFTPFVLR